jgi:hypothetical protein
MIYLHRNRFLTLILQETSSFWSTGLKSTPGCGSVLWIP